jgi:hypothetical protein
VAQGTLKGPGGRRGSEEAQEGESKVDEGVCVIHGFFGVAFGGGGSLGCPGGTRRTFKDRIWPPMDRNMFTENVWQVCVVIAHVVVLVISS